MASLSSQALINEPTPLSSSSVTLNFNYHSFQTIKAVLYQISISHIISSIEIRNQIGIYPVQLHKAMDWFSWLSKTSLEPSLVREYALDFAHNELEEDDIAHFNHEFLQSMGISIAKHRLEILKLARKEKRRGITLISRLISVIKRTNKIFGKYIRNWVHRENSALTVVPRRSYSSRWKAAMLKRNKTMTMGKQERKMIANVPLVVSSTCLDDKSIHTAYRCGCSNRYSSPMLREFDNKEEIDDSYDDGNHRSSGYEEEVEVESYGDGHLSTGFEETRWVEMFKDLKPT